MRTLLACTVLLTLSAVPAFGQAADSSGQPAATSSGAVDLSGFRDEIANRNKALADKVRAEQALVKKNSMIIDDVKKIDADNKRLDAERKALDAQNAEFERQRLAMLSVLGDTSTSSDTNQPAAPARVEPQPQPTRVESQPARVEAPAAHMELAGASVIPASSNMHETERPAQVADPIVRTPPVGQMSQPVQNSEPEPLQASASMPVAASATVVASSNSGPIRVPENQAMGLLLSPIRPIYPQIAQNARIQGEVVLDAVISKTGLVESVSPVSGPELLRRAAIDAVQNAHYQPFRVNGENVEMTTTVTVVFRMQS
jgi:protein TonB